MMVLSETVIISLIHNPDYKQREMFNDAIVPMPRKINCNSEQRITNFFAVTMINI